MFVTRKPAVLLAAAACALTFVATPSSAQTTAAATKTPVKVVATGLNGPRQLSASRGRFYVAESDTGQVSVIDPKTGAKRAVVTNLSSPQGVVRIKRKLYILNGDPSPDANPNTSASLAVVVAKPGQPAKKFADLLAYEVAHNPDHQAQKDSTGKPYDDALSNPYFVIRDRHGFLLVADAGANDVLKVNSKGKVSTFFVPPTVKTGACNTPNVNVGTTGCDSVPTGLAYGPHNTLYVSALTSEVPGQGRVYVVNARTGKLLRTIKGLSGPTGVAVSKRGTVYVSEVAEGAPEGDGPPPTGFDPSTIGQIVKITPGHARRYAQVTMPSGLLIKHGKLYASAWSIAGFLGLKDAGQVVRVADRAFVRP